MYEKIDAIKANSKKRYVSPLISSFNEKYNFDSSYCIDKNPENNWTYTESLRGCMVLISQSTRNEFVYFHIHPVQIEQSLDLFFIDDIFTKESHDSKEFLVISTGATITHYKDLFLNRLQIKYPNVIIQNQHVDCNANHHCSVYFNAFSNQLVVLEDLGGFQEKIHEQKITWHTSKIESNLLSMAPVTFYGQKRKETKPKERSDIHEGYETEAHDYFSKLIIDACNGVVSDGGINDVLKTLTMSEMCNQARLCLSKVDNSQIRSTEITASLEILTFLSNRAP